MAMTERKAGGLIVVAAAIWGLSFIFTKWGLTSCPPALYLLLRFAGALAITLVVFGRYLPTFDRETVRQGLALGSLFCFAFLLQTYSVQFTTVTRASFIAAMTLPATPFVTWFVLRRPVARWSVIGVLVALAGLYFLVDPVNNWNALPEDMVPPPMWGGLFVGDWIGFASVPVWAFYLNYMDVFTRGREGPGSTGKMLLMQFATALPILALVWLALESGWMLDPLFVFQRDGAGTVALTLAAGRNFDSATLVDMPLLAGDRRLWLSLAYNIVLASFTLTFLQTYAQRYTTPVKAMLLFQFEPVVATAAAILFLGEPLAWPLALGAALIVAGVLTSELGETVWRAFTGRADEPPPSSPGGANDRPSGIGSSDAGAYASADQTAGMDDEADERVGSSSSNASVPKASGRFPPPDQTVVMD